MIPQFKYGQFYSNWSIEAFDTKMHQLLLTLDTQYTKDMIEKELIPLLTESHKVNFRLLDYFVSIYARCNHASIMIYKNGSNINVFEEYCRQRDTSPEKYFCPFKKFQRVHLLWDGCSYKTTVAQLAYLQWAIDFGILDYVKKHLVHLTGAMEIWRLNINS